MKRALIVLLFLIGFEFHLSASPHGNKREVLPKAIIDYAEDYLASIAIDYEVEYKTYPDGKYCADVLYYNPNTGTRSSYKLNVKVENNEVTVIYWNNGGWLDQSHFCCSRLDSNGYTSFKSDKGYQYQVTITKEGGC